MVDIDLAEKTLVSYFWLVFIGSYISIIATFIAFLNSNWIPVWILLYLPINYFYQMVALKELGNKEDIPETASWPCGSRIMLRIQQWMWLWPWIYWKWNWGRKWAEKSFDFANKNVSLFFLFKLFTILSIILWFTLSENSTQTLWVACFFIFHILICSLQYQNLAILLFMIVMIVPFLICLFSESCIKDYCSCIFKMPKEPEVANHN